MNSLSAFTRSLRYLFPFVSIAIATSILFVMRDIFDTSLVTLLFLLSVGLSTALWGLGPGITAALLSFLVFNFFFIKPYYTFLVHRPDDLVILFVFLLVTVVISQLVGRAKEGMNAATSREWEATQLYEFSIALTGFHNEETIANVITSQVYGIFRGECVVLNLTAPHSLNITLPPNIESPSQAPDLILPIQSARGIMGKISLWRRRPSISTSEKRLLQTFASQGALAFERTWLAEGESRAKVLEESDRLKSALLSSVSHELRTPLSTIKAAATSLRSGEVNWDSLARADLLAAIDEEADHLNMLVGNLLNMSRIEAGALKPQRQWNVLSEIVGSVVTRMRRLIEGYQIQIDVPESLPFVPVDYMQMEQVFTNLISNSLKYAPGGTMIRISATVKDDDHLLVRVSNQGPQVPEEHIDRIFDKFYRITAADRVTGTGLGLSICKGIIDAHGGRIWAENLSDGFSFNFILPLTAEGMSPPELPVESETT